MAAASSGFSDLERSSARRSSTSASLAGVPSLGLPALAHLTIDVAMKFLELNPNSNLDELIAEIEISREWAFRVWSHPSHDADVRKLVDEACRVLIEMVATRPCLVGGLGALSSETSGNPWIAVRSNFEWSLPRLRSPGGADAAKALVLLAEHLAASQPLCAAVGFACSTNRADYKKWTMEGCVWRAGRGRDIGNYRYSVLFQLICRCSRVRPSLARVSVALERAAERYPSLAMKAWPSKMSLEMKGDVIEASLAIARLTGPEIPRHLRIAHEDYNAKMNDFDNAFDRMLRFATTDNDGPPSMAAFPPPDVLAKLMLMVFSGDDANFEKTATKIARFEVWNGDGVACYRAGRIERQCYRACRLESA